VLEGEGEVAALAVAEFGEGGVWAHPLRRATKAPEARSAETRERGERDDLSI
jgi:hypothetical protein